MLVFTINFCKGSFMIIFNELKPHKKTTKNKQIPENLLHFNRYKFAKILNIIFISDY